MFKRVKIVGSVLTGNLNIPKSQGVGKGFFQSSGTWNLITSLDFITNKVELLTSKLSIGRRWPAGLSYWAKSYICGGYALVGGNLSTIEGLICSTGVVTNHSVSLGNGSGGGQETCGINSDNFGYIGGGNLYRAYVDKFDFSTEVNAVNALSSGSSRRGMCGVNSKTSGYFAGGVNSDNTTYQKQIKKLIFDNNTFNNIASTLYTAKKQCIGVMSLSNGYFCSGYGSGTPGLVIDCLGFSTDTIISSGNSLSCNRYGGAGSNSNTIGYIAGGMYGARSVDRIDFSTNTNTLSSIALSDQVVDTVGTYSI